MTRRRSESDDAAEAAEELKSWMGLCAGLKKAVAVFAAAADRRGVAERFAEPLAQSVLAVCVEALSFDVKNGYSLLGEPDAARAFGEELKRILTRRAQRTTSQRGRHGGVGNGKKKAARRKGQS